MSGIWLSLLLTALRMIVTKARLDAVKQIVLDAMSSDLPADQKRAKVQSECRALFRDLGENVMNLAIEAALAWAKKR